MVAAALALPALAGAQAFGTFTPAPTLESGGHMGGGYLISSTNTLALMGQLRLSFYPGVDFGFQGGLSRNTYAGGNRTTLRLGGDLKYQLKAPSAEMPLAMAIDLGLGVDSGDHWNILALGPSLVVSRTFSGNLTPFASGGVLISNINVSDTNTSDTSWPIRLGTELKLSQGLAITGEFQIRLLDDFNDDLGFAIGINSPF